MSLEIPDDIVSATDMTVEELRREIAIMLFQLEKLTLAQASRLSGLDRIEMQRLLASRDISVHYTESDLNDDIETLRRHELL